MDFKDIVVKKGQSLTDISIQEYGNVEGVFAVMIDNIDKINGMSDVLSPGTILKIRNVNPYDTPVNGNDVTNTNPNNMLSNGYVVPTYLVPLYLQNGSSVIARDWRGMSEYQLELIN